MRLNSTKYYLALIFLTPIFFINNQWDGTIINYGFEIHNLNGVKSWYFEASSNFQFYIIKILFFIKEITNFSSEFIFDIFTIATLYLFCLELKKFFKKILNFNQYYENIFFIILITFPIWNFITEINLALYVFCFYLAILGYNLFDKKLLYKKFIGILIIFLSFSIKSNFALISAIAFLHFIINYIHKKNISVVNLLLIVGISLIGYLINSYFFPPYGLYEGYNEVNLNSINFNVKNLLDYLTFFVYYFTLPLILILIFKIKLKKKFKFFHKENSLLFLSVLIFTGLTLGPYYLVQKSTDIFNFSDFESRQVFSISIGAAFILVIFLNNFSKYLSKKMINYLAIFFVIQNLVLLLPSFYIKLNLSIVDTNLIKNFTKLEKPKSGYILIISDKLKKTSINSNFILFQSFGESKWFSKFISTEKLNEDSRDLDTYFKSDKSILDNENYRTKYAADNFKEQCFTIYKINDDVSKINLIKSNYLFNQEKYFKIKKIKSKC